MKTIVCNCGEEFKTDIPESFDAAEHPDLLEQLETGSFLSVPCPACGTIVKPELPVRIIDKSLGMDILFRPDGERDTFLTGRLDLPEAERVVFGYLELAEKVLIYKENLDDRAIEVIKYFYFKKAGSEQDLTIYLDSTDEKNLRFHIHGLRKDEIGIANIKRQFYSDTLRDLNDIVEGEEIQEIITPPFVSIKKVYLGED